MKTMKMYAVALLATIGMISCSDDDDAPEMINEEEVITTVELTLRAPDGTSFVYTSRDADGDGPDSAVITNADPLMANTLYTGSVRFLNETESPAEDITEEVEEEDDEHEVFYIPGSSLSVVVAKTNFDDDGNPLGTEFNLNTSDVASSGSLTVTLRHEPTKPNDGTLNGAGGETDVQVAFTVSVVQ